MARRRPRDVGRTGKGDPATPLQDNRPANSSRPCARTMLATVKAGARRAKHVVARWLLLAQLKLRTMTRFLALEPLCYELSNRRAESVTRQHRRVVEPSELLCKIREKNLLFTVTAGRTGTMLLQKMLSLLPDTTSLHEPEPAFQRYLHRVQHEFNFAREFLLAYKLPAICEYQTRSYCEMSHVFCKGFLEPLLDLGIQPNLVILRRRPRSIALSLLERYTIPERTHSGIAFLIGPRSPGVLPLEAWRRMTDYQLVFWYTLEIERRQREYTRLARRRGCAVHEVMMDDLGDSECFLRLAKALHLLNPADDCIALTRRHAAVARVVVNRNRLCMPTPADLDEQEEAVWEAVSAADPTLRSSIEVRYGQRFETARGAYHTPLDLNTIGFRN